MVIDRNVLQRHHIYMMSSVMSKVQTTVVSSFEQVIYNKDEFNKLNKTVEKMTLFLFDLDSSPLLGFTQIQYKCKSITWV